MAVLGMYVCTYVRMYECTYCMYVCNVLHVRILGMSLSFLSFISLLSDKKCDGFFCPFFVFSLLSLTSLHSTQSIHSELTFVVITEKDECCTITFARSIGRKFF
jgi:hypothetical protein